MVGLEKFKHGRVGIYQPLHTSSLIRTKKKLVNTELCNRPQET